MSIYVARWDCLACGHVGNAGPETRCPNCGSPRPEEVEFYLPALSEVVRDPKKIEEALSGPDWRCGHCGAHNKNHQHTCLSCGNPRDAKSEDVNLEEHHYKEGEIPERTRSKESGKALHQRAVTTAQRKKSRRLRAVMLIAGLLLLALVALGLMPSSTEVEVTGFKWARQIQMEQYEAVAHEDWRVPNDAFDVRPFKAVHHYDKVYRGTERRYRDVRVKVGEERYVCGKTDMGNGYFQDRYCTRPIYETRTEAYEVPIYDKIPVYRTKYRYALMQWVARPAYIIRQQGHDHEAQWPAAKQGQSGQNWRQGVRKARYALIIRWRGEDKEEPVGPNYWQQVRQGQYIPAKKASFFSWIYQGLSDPTRHQ